MEATPVSYRHHKEINVNRRGLFGATVATAVGAVAAAAIRPEPANAYVETEFIEGEILEYQIDVSVKGDISGHVVFVGEHGPELVILPDTAVVTTIIDMDDPAMVRRLANATVVPL